jgi:hypothetical protein
MPIGCLDQGRIDQWQLLAGVLLLVSIEYDVAMIQSTLTMTSATIISLTLRSRLLY